MVFGPKSQKIRVLRALGLGFTFMGLRFRLALMAFGLR